MLHKGFSAMDGGVWDKAPTTTNAVERLNGECKTAQPVALQRAVLSQMYTNWISLSVPNTWQLFMSAVSLIERKLIM